MRSLNAIPAQILAHAQTFDRGVRLYAQRHHLPGEWQARLLPTRKKILKRKSTYFPTGFAIGQPSNKTAISSLCRGVYAKKKRVCHEFLNIKSEKNILSSRNYSSELEDTCKCISLDGRRHFIVRLNVVPLRLPRCHAAMLHMFSYCVRIKSDSVFVRNR